MVATEKTCTTCELSKPLSEFSPLKDGKYGRKGRCKVCSNLRQKVYVQANAECVKTSRRNYVERNRDKVSRGQAEYSRKRRLVDPLFKLKGNLRSLIRIHLANGGYAKGTKTEILLGADYGTVLTHLKSTAIRNYGYYDDNCQYHTDHVIPCASAKTEEELIKLQHYTNLQLLLPKDNLQKSNKLAWGISE